MISLSLRPQKGRQFYLEYNSATKKAQNLEELFIQSTIENKPLVIRRYGRSPGGIGTHPDTQSIDGFLGYLERVDGPKPDCQIQGRKGSIKVDIKDLRQQFQQTPSSRHQIVNILGFPLMQDANLSGS